MTHHSDSYSVLMSVYSAEKPEFLRQSIDSVLSQTIPTDDFVIICDGPLTAELDGVLSSYNNSCINIIRLPVNGGLGKALSHGLTLCKHELVARMDSDDIALEDRMEKQLRAFSEDENLAMCSGTVIEFSDDINNIKGKRQVPSTNEEIRSFSRKRNPFNHPSMMFKKSAVINAGGYNEDYHLFEDYYLWVRMLMNNARGKNLDDGLVYMRVDDNTMVRRGGFSYAKDMLRFHGWLRKSHWSSVKDYMTGAIPHALVCILPAKIRKAVYKRLH